MKRAEPHKFTALLIITLLLYMYSYCIVQIFRAVMEASDHIVLLRFACTGDVFRRSWWEFGVVHVCEDGEWIVG